MSLKFFIADSSLRIALQLRFRAALQAGLRREGFLKNLSAWCFLFGWVFLWPEAGF
jgi:hypothetical protein